MTVEEFKKMINEVNNQAKVDENKKEEKKRRIEYEKKKVKDKEKAVKFYDDVIMQKETFLNYEKFIQEYLPNIIKELAYKNRDILLKNPDYKIIFNIDFYDPTVMEPNVYYGHFCIPVNKDNCNHISYFVSNTLHHYDISYHRQNKVFFYVEATLTDLFRVHFLENEHVLENWKEDINALLEDYDSSLKIPSKGKIKTKNHKK